MQETTATLLTTLTIAAVAITVLMLILKKPILHLIQTPAESFAEADRYLTVTVLGLIFIFGYNVFSAVMRGMGDSKRPLYFVLIACITNVILDLVLVAGLKMGALGAAIATVFSQAVSMITCIVVMIRNDFVFDFKPSSFIIKKEKATQKRLQNALEEIKRSNETISTIAKSYSSIYKVDFETDTYERISGSDIIPKTGCASEKMFDVCEQDVAPEYRNIIHQFANIETLTSRLEKEEDVLAEYRMADGNWHKLRIIVSKRDVNGKAIQAIATIRTISETKRKELNLFFEAEQAKREAKIKTRFLQSMSHDMRTPLNGIAGMLHIADQNPKNLELQKTTRNKVHQSLNYLISLVNDVLDMNDLESDHFTEEEVDFDITELLGNMNIDAQQLAQEKNIQYVLDWYEGQLSHSNFRGYPIYLSRILMIVVQNAVKFTPENGEIHVWMNEKCLDDSTSLLEFRCKDNGIGMSKDFIQHAFDLFAQEDSSSRSTYQGTGLGLSIAKKLVEYMHGNIQLESEKGIGTTVSIQIPFKLGKSIENKNNRNQQISLEGLCVLVAEDNDLNMEIVEYMLERNGIHVVCAKDGQEVIDLFEKSEVNEFDFILMDIMMPKLNGLDATRKIRSLKRQDAKTVPIIAMSANAFVEDIMNSKIAGMNMHLAKPLDETKLIEALKQCKKDEDFK